jgi:hypothetical protein
VPGVIDYATEGPGRGVFELGVARQIRSEQYDLLFLGQTLPGVDHIRRPVSRAVEEHDNRQGTIFVGRVLQIALFDTSAMSRPQVHLRGRAKSAGGRG